MEKNQYVISVKDSTKTMSIKAGELTSHEALSNFVREFNQKVKGIKASEYTLEIDSKEMKVLTPELSEGLKKAFDLYNRAGFSKVSFLINKDVILKMQYSRIARTVGLQNIEFIQ